MEVTHGPVGPGEVRTFSPRPRPTITLPPAPRRGPIVTPVDWSAGDRLMAQCFWASTDKDASAWTCDEREVARVINFGMKAEPVPHGTPFGHGHLTVHVDRLPLPIAGQMIRHRVQQFSGQQSAISDQDWAPNISQKSYRYVVASGDDLDSVMWIPEPEELRTQEGRPGAYEYHPLAETDAGIAEGMATAIRHLSETVWGAYQTLIAGGLAPEQARMFLPQGTYTRLYATASYRNWLTWLVQRNDRHAQAEIRQVAAQVEAIVEQCIPITYGLWLSHGRRPM